MKLTAEKNQPVLVTRECLFYPGLQEKTISKFSIKFAVVMSNV